MNAIILTNLYQSRCSTLCIFDLTANFTGSIMHNVGQRQNLEGNQ
jgi:hypothetical protein